MHTLYDSESYCVLHLLANADSTSMPLLGMASMNLVRLAISIFTWSIIIYAVLSWVSPGGYNPGAALIAAIVEPILAPVRRLVPLIGGLDLSPLFAIIALQALALLVPAGMACGLPGGSVF